MDKDIQKLTQNERYDLKRKQVMEEKEAYTNSSLENFTEHCFSRRLIDRLTEENKRLQAQLDKEIHYNRIMKSALEKYAFENTKMKVLVNDRFKEVEVPYANDTSLALQVLKEIDNKE